MESKRDPRTARIIDSAIEVHRELGPGLLEKTYERCLFHELTMRGIEVRSQIAVPVMYKGLEIDCAYQLDLLVEESVTVELKAVEKLLPIHEAQLLTYMKLAGIRTGLLLNFNVPLMRDGIKRMVL